MAMRLGGRVWASAVGGALVLACSGGSDVSTSTTDGGTSSSSSSGSSGASSSSGGGGDSGTATDSGTSSSGDPVTPPQTDLTFDADFIGKDGPHFITGTVTLPPGASAGRAVQIEVVRTDGFGGNQLGAAGTTGAGSTLTYKVTSLEPGVYKIGVRVDETGNQMVNDTGDYIGFAKGTTGAPKTTSATADEITITDAPITGVDLGLAVVP